MTKNVKKINVAIQGGGAHGAFAWGVLDRLLDEDDIEIEAITATSAGSMNAVIFAEGLRQNGRIGAKHYLESFWFDISQAGVFYSPLKRALQSSKPLKNKDLDWSPLYRFFQSVIRHFSPYQFNPANFNPLRSIIEKSVDFEKLALSSPIKLFLSATNVRSGKVRVFSTEHLSSDVVLASSCLPFLFQAVKIEGEYFWDGGYMGNPALFPLFYHTDARDILVVHINPIERHKIPQRASEIRNRINEISFNSSLLKEYRAIAFVLKLLEEDWLKPDYRNRLKHPLMHSIRTDDLMCDLSVVSKFDTSWTFLTSLKERGRQAADSWLEKHKDSLGIKGTIDLHSEFLGLGSQHTG
tara:strand:+ start:1803 stop:2861 length:1059 start_codon:yes stop_codon:yes gene_type:complete